MSKCANLWAVGFDKTGRAAEVRDQLTRLGWEDNVFDLLDVALAVRYADGSFTLNGEAFPLSPSLLGGGFTSFLAGLALGAPPLSSGAVTNLLGEFGGCAVATGISDVFIREVADLVRPGTSVLFVLDDGGDLDAILPSIRGMGGTVLKTNVDLERARRVQAALADSSDATRPDDG
jgi:uncharacterized membrane protein